MRKKLWEMTLCILYFMTLLYQLKTAEVISFKLELPMGAGAGCRVRAVIDISGNWDASQFINFYNLNMKKEKNHPCRIDNIFRKNYNNLNGQKKEHYLETKNR